MAKKDGEPTDQRDDSTRALNADQFVKRMFTSTDMVDKQMLHIFKLRQKADTTFASKPGTKKQQKTGTM